MYTALHHPWKKNCQHELYLNPGLWQCRPMAVPLSYCIWLIAWSLQTTNITLMSPFQFFSRTFSRIMLSWIGYNESQRPTKSRTTCQILLVSGKHKLHRTFWVFVRDFSAFQHNNFGHFMCQYNQWFLLLWLEHYWKNLRQMLHLMRVNVLLSHSSIFLST